MYPFIFPPHLASQLPRGAHHEESGGPPALVRARLVVIRETREVLDDGQAKGDGLSRSRPGLADDVPP